MKKLDFKAIRRKISYKIYYFFIGHKIQKNEEIIDGKRVWFISDMHFNHYRVYKWCRSDVFRNVNEMNRLLIKNWRNTVGFFDQVYCLGDFGPFKYRWSLKGRVSILKGNHDRRQWNRQKVLKYKDLKFLILHDPDDPKNPSDWFDGHWIIHGHTHINSPFIDIRRKRVNVSCEVINYQPINMEKLYGIIQESKNYKNNRKML